MGRANTLRGARYRFISAPQLKLLLGSRTELTVSPHLREFFYHLRGTESALVLVKNKRVVGIFCYQVKSLRSRGVYARGTYVAAAWRGYGIGSRLWRRVLDAEKPEWVDVEIASTSGGKLVGSMIRKYKNTTFKTFGKEPAKKRRAA